jgi:hypothetical protein
MSRHAHQAARRLAERWPAIAIFTAALTLVASGCASAASPVPTAPARTASPTHVLAPSPAMTLPSTPRPSPALESALPESGNVVFPGRYKTHFEPALKLTIDRQVDIDCAPGYRCRGDIDVNSVHWLDIEFGHDHPVEINMMRFDKVFDPKHAGKEMDPPTDLAAWISALPGVTVLARRPVEVGGVAAMQLDLRTGSQDLAFGPTGLADLPTLGFGAHQLHRVILIRRAGTAVIIGMGSLNTVAADDTAERLANAADILQPIVDSIVWE